MWAVGEVGVGAMRDKDGLVGKRGMFLSTRTINQQHNHFLGIPWASRERGSQTERPSVCWERRRRAGNQKDMLFTVCVTRPLSSQGPQASHRLPVCVGALCKCAFLGLFVLFLPHVANIQLTRKPDKLVLFFARFLRCERDCIQVFCKMCLFYVVLSFVFLMLFFVCFLWKLWDCSGSPTSLPSS